MPYSSASQPAVSLVISHVLFWNAGVVDTDSPSNSSERGLEAMMTPY